MVVAHTDVRDRKSTRLNSSHTVISYAVFCLKKKKLIMFQIWKKKYIEKNTTAWVWVTTGSSGSQTFFVVVPPSRTSTVSPFFFKATATTEIYTLSLHDALPI